MSKVADPDTRQLIGVALRDATTHGAREVDALHILRALTANPGAAELLGRAGINPTELAGLAKNSLPAGMAHRGAVGFGASAGEVLSESWRAAQAFGSERVAPEHVLLALVMSPDTTAGRLLNEAGLTPERLQQLASGQEPDDAEEAQSATPNLDKYGVDLTERARGGHIDAVIGRAQEIEQTVEILMRRTKNNPVLIGEAGVGKTAIVEGLALRIAEGDVPEVLLGKRVVALDLPGMLAGAKYRGDFEERMTGVLDEISAHAGEILLFIDELHTIVGAGGAEGAVDAGNMLKPKLARGELHVIGATTLDEYRKHIEKDPALERRFQPVQVDEPNEQDAIAILSGLRGAYQEHHGVTYTDEALTAAVELSVRYLPDRRLPDKAIDLMDQAGARKRLARTDVGALTEQLDLLTVEKDAAVAAEDYEAAGTLRDRIAKLQSRINHPTGKGDGPSEITAEDIAQIVARATGVPASQMTEQDKDRLRRLEDELHQRVIGQHDAVAAIARAVRRNRTGMADPGRPVGSFLFLGPTGVGKTELAKALAANLFGDDDKMIRLDMSEFGERHTVSRLVGAPPGYVGYGEAGQLTEQVRRNPYSVVLLDEVEKAHPDVFNLLLQVLDDGRLTDGQGRTVDFTNTVLIMTSNLGSDIISSRSGGIGFDTGGRDADGQLEDKPLRDRLMGRLRESFRPEFLNRIDEVVIFRKLEHAQLHQITDLLLTDSRNRLGAKNIEIEFTDAVVDWLAERGHQPEFGARPLRRTIQREIDDRLADLLIEERLHDGEKVTVVVTDDELELQVS
ncbi:ATP-dependent Clp protease ATP-binding subunit [Tomitella biformata]|uniref:ATP-dependent Clp protease ATP-binding subunit n=1 Tax=Tomitella biformata TaxID=630403 RepID=UPI00355838D9